MINLEYRPAFGFENKHCFAREVDTARANKLAGGSARDEDIYMFHHERNAGKIIAYVPLVSMYAGINRIRALITNKDSFSIREKVEFAVRSIFEILNLSLLLVIPDLIITAIRFSKIPPSTSILAGDI